MIKHYVEFLLPGLLMCETSGQEIEKRDISLITDIPDLCFAFRFYDVEEMKSESGEVLRGRPKNWGKTYYIDGKVFTKDEVDKEFPEQGILRDNMRINGYKNVIKTRLGNFQVFNEGDIIINANELGKKKVTKTTRRAKKTSKKKG